MSKLFPEGSPQDLAAGLSLMLFLIGAGMFLYGIGG